jgi:uncharacterized protein
MQTIDLSSAAEQQTTIEAPPVAPLPLPNVDLSRIAQDLQIRKLQVESVIKLLDEGNTVPFITRYRKERTGGLDEDMIRAVQMRAHKLRQLAERKQTILGSIEAQGKLTDELRQAILAAETSKRLEDLYLPYKHKKRTLSTTARERGLEPFAQAIWGRDPAVANLQEFAAGMVNPEKELHAPTDVLTGAGHIIAELIAETADVRSAIRAALWDTGKIATKRHERLGENEGLDFRDYFAFEEALRQIPPHRILAINRGKKENALQVSIQFDADLVKKALRSHLPLADHPHAEFLGTVAEDALARLILPSLETEIHKELRMEAEDHAVQVFARNLRSLLLQRPLRQRRVLGVDPGFRTGCKLAVLDEHGNLLDHGVIFPHPAHDRKGDVRSKHEEHARRLVESRVILETLIRKHQTSVIAIGNGTACRETEEIVSDLIVELEKRRSCPAETAPTLTAAPDVPKPSAVPTFPAGVAEAVALPPPESNPSVTSAAPILESSLPAPVPGVGNTEAAPSSAADQAVAGAAPLELVPAASSQATTADGAAPSPAPASPPPPIPLPQVDPTLPPAPADLAYIIVNEAGASHYSVSAVGKEEFPTYDATLRGTVSIGRRLQDPLSELVKIDPQNIGVGLYQHDVNPKFLGQSLESIVESCVNYVGVDLNTASASLLRHVSGLNHHTARQIVEHRANQGPFPVRELLRQVPGIGDARFVQAAGFLKVLGGSDPLDQTWIHPESYAVASRLLSEMGYTPADLLDKARLDELNGKLQAINVAETAARLQVGEPTLHDIIAALARPGRDPREDLPPPIFRKGILKLEDLAAGMELKGTVLNVVDFGAFVDIGLKDSGLVHISQLANRYVKSPYEVIAVGDVVTVWVMAVDSGRKRVSLTMIKPGTERKPPERKPRPDQNRPKPQPPGQQQDRPPRSAAPRRDRGPAQPTGQGAPHRPPQRGQRSGPQHGGGRPPMPAPATGAAHTPQPSGSRAPASPPPRPPQRKPHRPAPRPNLTKAALEGAVPLRTFGELEAFFAAKVEPPPPKPAVPPTPVPEANSATQIAPMPPQPAEPAPTADGAAPSPPLAPVDPQIAEQSPGV